MKKVIVIGGGPAGMMAALIAAGQGAEVRLLEKNSRLGLKLSITGKGRCNVTNDSSVQELIKNIPQNGSFLYSCLSRFDAYALQDFFRSRGVALKTERGKRVFPESDNARDIVNALKSAVEAAGVQVLYGKNVDKLLFEDSAEGRRLLGCTVGREQFFTDAVICTCGGLSYPTTGSDGGGYELARHAGHSIIPPKPALVPLHSSANYIPELAGLSLKNVEASLYHRDKLLGKDFGELLFTHKGVSGPIILSLSFELCALSPFLQQQCLLKINLKPALDTDTLNARVQRDLDKYSRRHLINALNELLPLSLIPIVVRLSGVFAHKECNQISREERQALCSVIAGFPVPIAGTAPIEEAIVTAGGVCVKELNPKTMESRLMQGLYFCGEVIDVQGYTGGFNLQAAFSTGYAAGMAAADNY